MTLDDYFAQTDWSDLYATDPDAVRAICQAAQSVAAATILELGSHRGLSAAALALACPAATVTAVDLGDEVPPEVRLAHYAAAGVQVVDVLASSGDYLRDCQPVDVIFHDSIHGSRAVPEYFLAWQKCRRVLAVHDWEQIDGGAVLAAIGPASSVVHTDRRGRQTAILFKP